MRVELPAMIAAFEVFAVESATVQRHPAVRAGVAQGEAFARTVAANDEWNLKERRLVQLITLNSSGRQRA